MTSVEYLFEEILKLESQYYLGNIGRIDLRKKRLELLEKAKEMEAKQKIDTSNVTRVEVIQHSEPHNGRAYTNYNAKDVKIELQDDNKTLKIFLK